MAEFITAIQTADGEMQIDYNALAHLPTIPKETSDIKLSDSTANSLGLTADKNVNDVINALVNDYNTKINANDIRITDAISDYNTKINASNQEIASLCDDKIPMMRGDELVNHMTFLQSFHSIEVGPNMSSSFVDASDQRYKRICNLKSTLLKGKYSYGYEGCIAYKLDHTTKQAIQLCDLSSHVGTTPGKQDDGIIAVDENYIYFVKHIVNNEAGLQYIHSTPHKCIIYKFNHSGEEVAKSDELPCSLYLYSEWIPDEETGENTQGKRYVFTSAFDYWLREMVYQTKNFIVIYNDNYGGMYAISKANLTFVGDYGSVGGDLDGNDTMVVPTYRCRGQALPLVWYNSDMVVAKTQNSDMEYEDPKTGLTSVTGNLWHRYKIEETGCTDLRQGNEHFFKDYFIGTSDSANFIELLETKTICDIENKQYVWLKFQLHLYPNSHKYYAVVSEDNLDLTTGQVEVQSYTRDVEIPFGIQNPGQTSFVCDMGESYQRYKRICNLRSTLLKGRYSYGYEGCIAYKLDHTTKQAIQLCDLSSYVGNTDYAQDDGIVGVDENYVYFVTHTVHSGHLVRVEGPQTGREEALHKCIIYKFDHFGTLIKKSVETACSALTTWGDEDIYNNGYEIETWYYDTIFCKNWADDTRINQPHQTKNYILMRKGGAWLYAVSKESLAIIEVYEGLTSQGSPIVLYQDDVVAIMWGNPDDPGLKSSWWRFKINETEVEDLGVGSLFHDRITDSFYNAIVQEHKTICDIDNQHQYFWLHIKKDGADKSYYTILTEENFSQGYAININNYTASFIELKRDDYDPIVKDFTSGGCTYQVYPVYIPPITTKQLNSKFTPTPFFKTDGYLYCEYPECNAIYKMKNETLRYMIDRVEEVE